MNPFSFPRGKKRGADLVINSNSWEMSFLSGGKKRVPPLSHGLGRPQRGKEMGTTNRAKSGIRHGPGSSAKILKTPRKRWENKVFWKMLRLWSPQKHPETLKTLGKTRYSAQK